ncbi:MAG TPA: hypothetical protein VFE30_08505 [Anaeromyxobacteraceae bacterium]|nr:hypothetical protein [Anaeromyxobacteraceae bacterium]
MTGPAPPGHAAPFLRRGRLRAVLARPAFAAALTGLAALLFCWPFVLAPPPSLATACGLVFAAWAAVIATICAVARALGGEEPDRGDGG